MTQPWPDVIRMEVKTTTGESVPVPAREIESLAPRAEKESGIIAVMFFCGDRSIDGRWLIADAEDTLRQSTSDSSTLSKSRMQQAHRTQKWLAPLKSHVDELWPAFLQAFLDDAMQGHEVLCKVLQECHEQGLIDSRLPAERILEIDHRDAVRHVIETFGESQAGHIFQDLIAYLVGFAGYKNVLLNPVGVPDVTVSKFQGREDNADVVDLGQVTSYEAERLIAYCERVGDTALADRLKKNSTRRA